MDNTRVNSVECLLSVTEIICSSVMRGELCPGEVPVRTFSADLLLDRSDGAFIFKVVTLFTNVAPEIGLYVWNWRDH